MGVNRTPGETASGFRMYVDNTKERNTATEEDVVLGAWFKHGTIVYEVTKIYKDDTVRLEHGSVGRSRSMIIPISDLVKLGSEYILQKHES